MTEFKNYSTLEKWDSLATRMRNIQRDETAFSVRRRLNHHHSVEQVRQETMAFRNEQWIKWCEVKDLYAEFRDELYNTYDRPDYANCRNILERIFTNDLDEALRQTLGE